MRRSNRFLMGSALTIFAMGSGSAAFAQSTSTETAAQADESTSQTGGDILVTARKRSESQRDVPMFITAQLPETLERTGVTNTNDFIGKLPSISKSSDFLSPGKDFALIVVRGIGANGGQEPAAPVFIDGVYMPRLGFDTSFNDVERVEVLYGPQSTLFGRNTEAGAINIVTRRPTEDFRAQIQFGYGSFNTFEAKGAVSGPIAENLFAGLSVEGSQTDGFLRNIGTQNNISAQGAGSGQPGARLNADVSNLDDPDTGRDVRFRGALRWVPSSQFEAYLTVDGQFFRGGFGLPGVREGCRCYTLDTDLTLLAKDKNYGGALHLNWDTGAGFEVTSISAYRNLSTIQPFDFDGGSSAGPTGAPIDYFALDGSGNRIHGNPIPGVSNSARGNFQDYRIFQDITSQEIRVSSNSKGAIDWLLGGFYFKEGFKSQRRIDMLGANGFAWFNRFQDVDIDRKGGAVFGQVNWNLSDRFQLSGGLRYSDESSSALTVMEWYTPLFLSAFGGINNPNGGTHTSSLSQSNVSFSASARYRVSDDINVYVTAANAFKAGGYQLAPSGDPTADTPYKAETAMSYEAGIKARAFDRKLQFNLAGYYIKVSDQQIRTIALINGLAFTREQNAAKASSRGFNFDATFQPSDTFQLNAALGYTDARLDEFIADGGLDFSGEPSRFVPKWTANVGAEVKFPMQSGGWFDEISLFADWQYVDKIVQGFDGVSVDVQLDVPSYNIFNAGTKFKISDTVDASFRVANVFDSYIVNRKWNVFFFSNPGGQNRVLDTVVPPRSVTFTLSAKF